ncbi:MAG: DegT/DnrJ/EryC1/StrS family aminotransferase [Candidatus Saganbacteria bacterium]|nr:DegT/DnrJ/EryC1/StrS family aminotransferase [Candidatus Saganbacteria bacterium]
MIPVNEPLIKEKEIENVLECLKTGWISSEGKFISEFEQKWAQYCGKKHGIAVSNGTTALEVAIKCLDLAPGDEVILSSFTIISCAQAVVYARAVPVLVDSEPRTWNMDVAKIEEKITQKTRAIMPVHIYGHSCDMDPILALAKKYNLKVIEDAAEVHGAEYKGKKCGSFGDLSCFSFYANKIITTGEGGMILTDNDEYADKSRSLKNLCFRPERRFYHTELGNNFRLTNMQAAIGSAQIDRIEAIVEKKRKMAKTYTDRLRHIKTLQLPVEEPWAKNVYWMYGVVINESTGMDAVSFAKKLADKGVATRPFFLGMHEQPVFHEMGLFKSERYPVCERIARQGLYLPSGLTLTDQQIEMVCTAVEEILG